MTQLPTQYQEYIHLSRYARWSYEEGRRETWSETVERYFNFFINHLHKNCGYSVQGDIIAKLEKTVLNLDIMTSMRCLMTAGPAI